MVLKMVMVVRTLDVMVGCVFLLLCIIGSGFLLRSSVVVMHYQPPKANHQADHNGADNGG
jgi:hypothetical protein